VQPAEETAQDLFTLLREPVLRKFISFSLLNLTLLLNLACITTVTSSTQASIMVDSTRQYQTITGWEAESQAGEVECDNFSLYANDLFDQAVNDLGINRIRLAIKSGTENPTDYYSLYIQGKISYDEWKSHRYEIINDNSNQNQTNLANFHFTELDYKIEKVVIPLQQHLTARGEKLFVNLNYVDFGESPFEHKNYPQEYAEFVLATYQHIKNKYGWTPDAWEMVLEPDNAGWSATQIGNALAAAATRLKNAGFQPFFIAPSNADMGESISYFKTIIDISGVQPNLKEFSYHRYTGVSMVNLEEIASLGDQYNVNTAMLEHIGSGYEDLHQDLKVGNNSAWQQFTLAYCSGDDGGSYYWIDYKDPDRPEIRLGNRTKFLRQYFKYVRNGAVRIGATTDRNEFDPLAFINKDGGYVVVVNANQGGSFSVSGLPAGGYGIKYTTSSSYDVNLKDVVLVKGQVLITSIPASGVLTIYSKPNAAETVYSFVPIIHR
jgi:hypothetical protein